MNVCVYSKEVREESDYVYKFLYERIKNAKSDTESKDYERVIDYITKIEDNYIVNVKLNVKLIETIDELTKGGLKNEFNERK